MHFAQIRPGPSAHVRAPGDQEAMISQLGTTRLHLLSCPCPEEETVLPSESRDHSALPCSLSVLWRKKDKSTLQFPALLPSLLPERICTVELIWKGENFTSWLVLEVSNLAKPLFGLSVPQCLTCPRVPSNRWCLPVSKFYDWTVSSRVSQRVY